MIKSILMILILCICTELKAQQAATPAKPAAPPKEQYKTDGTKTITLNIALTVPVSTVDSYLFVEQSGGVQAIQGSDRLTGAQITQLTAIHRALTDSVNNAILKRYAAYIKADLAKFTADTTLKYHPVVKKGEKQ